MSEQKIIEELEKIAAKEPADLESGVNTIYDVSGGNYDDAYYIGSEDGEIYLARRLLEKYKKD